MGFKGVCKVMGILFCITFLSIGCAGLQDWIYDLPNNYRLGSTNPYSIGISVDWELKSRIYSEVPINENERVVQWRSNGKYVCVISVAEKDIQKYWDGDKVIGMFWYIYNRNDSVLYGPYKTEIDYEKQIALFPIDDLSAWTDVFNNSRVSPQVVKFSYDQRYVQAISISPDDYNDYLGGKEVEMSWYIVDTEKDFVYGPLEENEFDQKCVDFEIDTLISWTDTYPRPDGSKSFSDR